MFEFVLNNIPPGIFTCIVGSYGMKFPCSSRYCRIPLDNKGEFSYNEIHDKKTEKLEQNSIMDLSSIQFAPSATKQTHYKFM